ncbi:MAG: carboxypeptidase regulatory-like domain-containing protein, partial [Methanomassiliicoccales archaeon]|nr:carboxypeptidase regulatory-like domain-containing protein [Methanomassiliicoccales archaeon]
VSTFSTGNEDADTSAPVIEHVQTGSAEVGTAFHLTANVTDVSKLASVTLTYVDIAGAYHSLAMGLGLAFFDAWIPAQSAPGTVRYSIESQDEFGNVATTGEYALGVYDTTPPSVRIVSPSSGTEVSSLINIETVAEDNYGISSVEFSVDGIMAMNDTVEPYVFAFNPSMFENGSHTVDVTAYDLAGMRTTASIDIEVNKQDITPPSLTMVYPSNGNVGVNVSLDMFVAFSEAMDVSSTESAISLETGGSWVSLSRTWQDESMLTIRPIADLQYATDYTLHVNASAMDVSGNMLQGNMEFTFRTQSRDGAQTVSGVVVAGSAPISGAVVTDGYRTVLTDEYGNFVFPSVPSGSYSLSASKWNYSCEQVVRVTLYSGQSVSGLKFVIVPVAGASTITGIILNNMSSPLMGALVTVDQTSQTAFSDANGRFIIANVTPDTYTVKVSKQLYKTETVSDVIVSQGEDVETVSLTLHSNSESSSSGSTSPNALAVGDLALPFMIGAGVAALAGGMVMRRPLKSDRKGLFSNGKNHKKISNHVTENAALEEKLIAARVGKNAVSDGDQKALDSLVDLLGSEETRRTKRVVSKIDADGEEDFNRGLKELEKLR